MLKQLFVLISILSLTAPSQAAIIGMLYQDENTKIEVLSSGIPADNMVEIKVTHAQDMPKLYISEYLSGTSFDMQSMMDALQSGKEPEPSKVAGWMQPDPQGVESIKLGLFVDGSKMHYQSLFTGQAKTLPHAVADRIKSEKLSNGTLAQTYRFDVSLITFIPDMKAINAGQKQLQFVSQGMKNPGDFDASLISVSMPTGAVSCNKEF